MSQNYYQTLEVQKTATQDEIKRSYRNLAKKYHPDANPGRDTESKMKEINAAYDILGDAQKREQYDRFGSNQQYTRTNQQSQQYDPFAQFFEEMMRQQQNQQQNQQYQQQYQRRRTYTVRPFGLFSWLFWMYIINFVLNVLFRF